tara:strand:+ start:166 stop:663 length:498 start_codon:yes stop_codon:yes gene_type:complete
MKNILNNIGLIDDYPNCYSEFLFKEFGGWCSEYIYCSIDNEHIERYKSVKKGDCLSVLFIFMNDTLNPQPTTYGVYATVCNYIDDDIIISKIYYLGEAPTMMQVENPNNIANKIVTQKNKSFSDKYQMGERFVINRVINTMSELKDLISLWDEEKWYMTDYFDSF